MLSFIIVLVVALSLIKFLGKDLYKDILTFKDNRKVAYIFGVYLYLYFAWGVYNLINWFYVH